MRLLLENVRVRAADGTAERTLLSVDRFTLASGERLGLRGASGSGKTTFLKAISGILRAEGSVLWDDTDLSRLSEAERDAWRGANVGFLFQDFRLFDGLNALENVLLPVTFTRSITDADRRRGERAANNLMTVTLLGALVVGHGGAAGVPDLGGPDLGVVAVADDGHIFFQPRIGPQLCRQQDASLLVRHHFARGAEQIAGDGPAVHQLIAFQLVRQPLDFLHGQCEQAVVHPFQHHEAFAHGFPEFGGEIQPSFGVNGVIVPAKKHVCFPLSGGYAGPWPYFYPLCPTDTYLL